jgi:predicted enzyme related to lactoylglutathione lyase
MNTKTSKGVTLEVGLVSADRRSVDFYVTVFGLTELPTLRFDMGILYRLEAGDGMVKVLIPTERPALPHPRQDMSECGLSYLTMRVTDFDDVVARVTQNGGVIVAPPRALDSDRRLAMVHDPDGTLIEVVEVTAKD